jgi:hypothetical protein
VLLAHVAVLRLDWLPEVRIAIHLALLEAGRWEDVRAGEHCLPAQRPDSRPVERLVLPPHLLRFAAADAGSHQLPAGHRVGSVYVTGRLQQPLALIGGHLGQEAPVGDDRFQQLGGGAEPVEECGVRALVRRHEVCCRHGAKSTAACGIPGSPTARQPCRRVPSQSHWSHVSASTPAGIRRSSPAHTRPR